MIDDNGMPFEIIVDWDKEYRCRSFLRNGYAHQDGIGLQAFTEYHYRVPHIRIFSVNSNQEFTSGHICIPVAHLDEVIEALITIAKEATHEVCEEDQR